MTTDTTTGHPIEDDARMKALDALAECIYNSHGYAMGGTWQEMKDRFIGDDKPNNCWKGIYAHCMKIASDITSQYTLTQPVPSPIVGGDVKEALDALKEASDELNRRNSYDVQYKTTQVLVNLHKTIKDYEDSK